MTHARSGATALSNGNCNAANIFFGAVRIPTILEEGEPSVDRVQVEFQQLVCHDVRFSDFAAIDSQQFAGIDFEAELRFSFSLGKRTEHANSSIAPDVVVSRA